MDFLISVERENLSITVDGTAAYGGGFCELVNTFWVSEAMYEGEPSPDSIIRDSAKQLMMGKVHWGLKPLDEIYDFLKMLKCHEMFLSPNPDIEYNPMTAGARAVSILFYSGRLNLVSFVATDGGFGLAYWARCVQTFISSRTTRLLVRSAFYGIRSPGEPLALPDKDQFFVHKVPMLTTKTSITLEDISKLAPFE